MKNIELQNMLKNYDDNLEIKIVHPVEDYFMIPSKFTVCHDAGYLYLDTDFDEDE